MYGNVFNLGKIYVRGLLVTPIKQLAIALVLTLVSCISVQAQSSDDSGGTASVGGSLNCADAEVVYQDSPDLTPEERSERMDQALYESLRRFDDCQAQKRNASGGGMQSSQAAAGIGGSEGRGSGTDGFGEPTDSAMGEGEPEDNPEWSDTADAESPDGGLDRNPADPNDTVSGERETVATIATGKIPDDIPPADNDSVLEAQIRKAAIEEQDPEVKKRLWNEYRKYKGLPPVTSDKSQ